MDVIIENKKKLEKIINVFNDNQIMRIQDNSSKTRLSILFFGLIWDTVKIVDNVINLLNILKSTTEKRKELSEEK
jgi:hypothetical protein